MSEEQAPRPEHSPDGVNGGHAEDDAAEPVEAAHPLRTGDPEVDAVIDDVARIGDRPLPEQPAAFEDAHERLRSSLDRPSGDERPTPE